MSKIVFLDFDGPLITHPKDPTNKLVLNHTPNTECATTIQQISTNLNCKIVVISTWRSNISYAKKILCHANLLNHLHPDWATIVNDQTRAQQILTWLSQHPEVTSYVILDDEPINHPKLIKNYISCDLEKGLPPNCYQLAKEILSKKISKNIES